LNHGAAEANPSSDCLSGHRFLAGSKLRIIRTALKNPSKITRTGSIAGAELSQLCWWGSAQAPNSAIMPPAYELASGTLFAWFHLKVVI
jgi:hypothetical protein